MTEVEGQGRTGGIGLALSPDSHSRALTCTPAGPTPPIPQGPCVWGGGEAQNTSVHLMPVQRPQGSGDWRAGAIQGGFLKRAAPMLC